MHDTCIKKAEELIKKFEGVSFVAYLDGSGVPTIGYGSTYYLDNRKVRVGDEITSKEALQLLNKNIQIIKSALDSWVKIPLNDNQKAALISLIYNIGAGNFRFSTMLKLINEGKLEEAAGQFDRWIWDDGKRVRGLIRRRTAEKLLFLEPI